MQLPFHLRNLTVLSPHLPVFLASILGDLGSQPALFCRYSNYRIQYKGPVKKFFASECTVTKLFSWAIADR